MCGKVLEASLCCLGFASPGFTTDNDGLKLFERGHAVERIMSNVVHMRRHLLSHALLHISVGREYHQKTKMYQASSLTIVGGAFDTGLTHHAFDTGFYAGERSYSVKCASCECVTSLNNIPNRPIKISQVRTTHLLTTSSV